MKLMSDLQVAAIIPAAGSGRRMNTGLNKIWLPLGGRSMISHILTVFSQSERISQIVLVVNEVEQDLFAPIIQEISPKSNQKISLVVGGHERQNSVSNGLNWLKSLSGWNAGRRLVVIHDAARALLTSELLEKAIESGVEYRAAGVGVPLKDTIKISDTEGFVIATPERSALWAIQTPQVFDFDLLVSCYEKVSGLGLNFSDDCGVVEYCGFPVKLVPGSYENIKITTPEDLIFGEAILRRRTDANRAGV